jgi:hypothetical protein
MTFRLALILIAISFSLEAQADIYKCEAENGDIAYSQVPCPKQKTTTVATAAPKSDGPVDCRWSATFANDVARRMRSGMASDQLFNMYGGIDSISPGTLNIINYVYRFRGNEAMPVERISSLAASMCKAGSLGDVRCESLPYGQDPGSKRCEAGEEEFAPATQPLVRAPDQLEAASDSQTQSQANNNFVKDDSLSLENERRETCRDSFRDQIDAIDAEMRSGYSTEDGERYRQRLRSLTTRMREC